jgi:hypothetical protein
MALKTIDQSPTLGDIILFEIKTPGTDGCFTANPYKVDRVQIYFIERNFTSGNLRDHEHTTYDEIKLRQAELAEKEACDSPTAENIAAAETARDEANKSGITSTFYYNEAIPVDNFGTDDFPAWLSTDTENAILTNVPEDEEGDPLYGHFTLEWNPIRQLEGQYVICWTWTPEPAGDSLNAFIQFDLFGDTKIRTVTPTHRTIPGKYETLLDRYTPQMFKEILGEGDLTPSVLGRFNQAIAKGFTVVEDLGNQMIDLLDANATSETYLQLLANLFNLQLRSDDSQLWRRQIKNAIPLYKKKGTLPGLSEALAQADITLNKLTLYWQIISAYTWVEGFPVVSNTQTTFILEKNPILPIDPANFELFLRPEGDDDFVELTPDYVIFTTLDGVTTMTWVGDSLSIDPITLKRGDYLKVTYQVNPIPNAMQQSIEDYIRTLPLADDRDDRDTTYPLKNWNVRLIAEDDVLFDVVIPTRQPYKNAVVFGTIRTEFPFSEQIYNMDEWNGSLRDSTEPCDIDKDFLDCCTACLGSKFSVDLEIEDLSDDRLVESLKIIDEYKPFHAVLHTMNFSGLVEDFINTNSEEVEALVTTVVDENVFCGTAQEIFSRTMEHGLAEEAILRDAIADLEAVDTDTGTVSSKEIVLASTQTNFQQIGLDNSVYLNDPGSYVSGSNNNLLEILAPATGREGSYTVSGDVTQNTVRIDQGSPDTISETPFNMGEFTFRLSNIVYTNGVNTVTPDDLHYLADEEVDYVELNVKSTWDVANDPDYTGGAWSVKIGATTYTVENVLPDGSLELSGGTAGVGISYTLLDDLAAIVETSTAGVLVVEDRAIVAITDAAVSDIRILVDIGDYVLFGGTQYQVIGFVEGADKELYIEYSGAGGAGSITVYRRLLDNLIGHVDYRGFKMVTPLDYEVDLFIQNGANAPGYPWEDGGFLEQGSGTDYPSDDITIPLSEGQFKEDFLIYIGTDWFIIADIDGTDIVLLGPKKDWPTTGVAADFTIYKSIKKAFSVREQRDPPGPGHDFDFVDRRGKDIYTIEEETGTPMALTASMLNNKDNVVDTINQQESVSFEIEWADGNTEEGEI